MKKHLWHHLFTLSLPLPRFGGSMTHLASQLTIWSEFPCISQLKLHFPGIPTYLYGENVNDVENT